MCGAQFGAFPGRDRAHPDAGPLPPVQAYASARGKGVPDERSHAQAQASLFHIGVDKFRVPRGHHGTVPGVGEAH